MLGLVDETVAQGQDVTMDCFHYAYSSTRLLILIPEWAFNGGPEKLKQVLRSPEGRERLRQEIRPRSGSFTDLMLTNFKQPHNRKFEGKSLAEAADMMEKREVDTICDLSLDEDLQISYVSPGPNLATLPDFITHPRTMIGTDAVLLGEYPNPRSYGTFPTILAEYVREEGRLTLEEAIRKMTFMAAHRLDIRDRGMLRDGMKADIVVFDPQTVKSPSTVRDPKQFPIGIEYVLVNGRIVVDQGQHTGVLAGRGLRHGRA